MSVCVKSHGCIYDYSLGGFCAFLYVHKSINTRTVFIDLSFLCMGRVLVLNLFVFHSFFFLSLARFFLSLCTPLWSIQICLFFKCYQCNFTLFFICLLTFYSPRILQAETKMYLYWKNWVIILLQVEEIHWERESNSCSWILVWRMLLMLGKWHARACVLSVMNVCVCVNKWMIFIGNALSGFYL